MAYKAENPNKDLYYVRGYCRVCNRHFFYRHQLDTQHTQIRQTHKGVCQICRYSCARMKDKSNMEE